MPHCLTVGQLLYRLQKLDSGLPVRLAVNSDWLSMDYLGTDVIVRDGVALIAIDGQEGYPPSCAMPSPEPPSDVPNPTEGAISPQSHPFVAWPLDDLAPRPMPSGVRGALVHRVSALLNGPLDVAWLPADAPRLPFGRIRLHWERASMSGWDVTAHLGLANAEVLLASWPAAPDDWPHLVRPTIHEVRGLCSALAVATAALDLATGTANRSGLPRFP